MELLVVLAVVAILLAMLVPSLGRAKDQARMAVCAQQMRTVGVGLKQFLSANANRTPPFAFSDHLGNLPLSGHWGGKSQPADPDCFGRRGMNDVNFTVNLWRLAGDRLVLPAQLLCPAADASLLSGLVSYFPYTSKFSTYCLRTPYSVDIFRDCPMLAHYGGRELLAIYTAAVGGETIHVGTALVTVPLVRADLPYRETDAAGRLRNCDLLAGAVMADQFWYQQQRSPAPARPGLTTYQVNASWCHQGRFNVLFGDGAVQAVEDDGTIRANTVPPDSTLPDDHANYSTYAIAVWRYFEDRR